MNRVGGWLAAAAVGVGVGAASFAWLVGDAALAATTGLFWTLAVGLTRDHYRLFEAWTGDGGAGLWSGAFGGLATLAAVVGLSPTLPVSAELRLALGLFVLGVALTMVNVGMRGAVESGAGDPGEATDSGGERAGGSPDG